MFIYNEKLSEHPEYAHYRKITFFYTAGTGTDTAMAVLAGPRITDQRLSDEVWAYAQDHAESYGIYTPDNEPDPEDYDSVDEYDDALDDYDQSCHDYEQVEGHFEPFKDVHVGCLVFGNRNDFQWTIID